LKSNFVLGICRRSFLGQSVLELFVDVSSTEGQDNPEPDGCGIDAWAYEREKFVLDLSFDA